jgi:hypothetical protein
MARRLLAVLALAAVFAEVSCLPTTMTTVIMS